MENQLAETAGLAQSDASGRHSPLTTTTAFFVLIGVLVLVAGIVVDQQFPATAISGTGAGASGTANIARRPYLLSVLIQFLSAIGLSAITAGVFSILLNMRPWRKYFQEGLAEIVIKQEYLSRLSPTELGGLMRRIAQHVYRNATVPQEGSYFGFCNTRLLSLCAGPYRESLNSTIILQEAAAGRVLVSEKIDYVCRSVNGRVQPTVAFTSDELFADGDPNLQVTISAPRNDGGAADRTEVRYPAQAAIPEAADQVGSAIVKRVVGNERIYELDLAAFQGRDEISVTIEASYEIAVNRLLTWQMSLPSKTINFTIKHPDTLTVEVEPFGFWKEEGKLTNQAGLLTFRYSGWLPPSCGFAWTVSRRA